MTPRDLTQELISCAKIFPAIAVLGPRQSGKTTLVQHVFSHHNYVSLEDLDVRMRAQEDPRKFLKDHGNDYGLIIDEVQRVPELFSYMQTIIDAQKKKGYFIVTGSQNILVNQAVTQTLAGRLAVLTLFPFSIHELEQAQLLPDSLEQAVFNGGYPLVYAEDAPPTKLYAHYVRNYLERDVRDVKKIFELSIFQKFLQQCAGRVGQLINYSSLASDCGIDQKTAKAWISLLEATYVIFLLQPYYKNFSKRLVKQPKLYFVDTGLACSLLSIKSSQELSVHFARGGLVESFFVADFFKQFYNMDQRPTLYFWRDHTGNEVDCIVETALSLYPVEIKAGHTVGQDYFKPFVYWRDTVADVRENNFIIYGGQDDQSRDLAKILSWRHAGEFVSHILQTKK